MKKYLLYSLLTSTLTLALLMSSATYAESEAGVSKQQAVNIAQQYYPGRVLAVKLKDKVYRVKTLNDNGEVRIISVDAETGKIISEK